MNDVQIVGWQDDYQQDYYNLAAEWLERYLSIEPGDLALMEHPREAVIARGGDIFFARLGGKNVGTISLVPHAPAVYEVAKFAVTPACQGQHVGSLLLEHLLARARAREAEKLVLYTSHILQPAFTVRLPMIRPLRMQTYEWNYQYMRRRNNHENIS